MLPVIVGFGMLAGTGIGLGYAAATPAAVKWFPPEKTGLIAGLVVYRHRANITNLLNGKERRIGQKAHEAVRART